MIRVRSSIHDGVAQVVLDDSARKNAMSEELGEAFEAVIHDLQKRAEVRAVVVTGAGGAFSAGGDLAMLERLKTLAHNSHDDARRHMLGFYSRFLSLLDLEVPTLAAIQGPAIGAGACVAAACDVVVAGADAVIAFNFVALGLHPGMGGSYLLPRKVGAQRAAELLFTGRRFDAQEAKRIGFAVDVADNALEAATAIAQRIARQGPHAVKALKRSISIDRGALLAALEREADAQATCYASAEYAEGLRAVVEKRPPSFS